MKRFACSLLCAVMLISSVSCSAKQEETSKAAAATSAAASAEGTSGSEGSSGEEQYHHEFDPHVYPKMFEENFDDTTKESFFSFCDALLAGEEEFYCPDEITMFNITSTISSQCMPLADSYVNVSKGHIEYTIPKEEYLVKVREFKDMITSILDECIKPGYDDVDKALALYHYFETHYTYDHEAAESTDFMDLSAYRLLTGHTGICQEIAPAYAYLMMQAGVDCTTCGGLNNINEAHEWAFACLGGEYYHIDPTWVITDPGTLKYFGMTDDKRVLEGSWDMKTLNYGSANIFDDRGVYKADSTRFEQLWDSSSYDVDYDANKVHYYKLSDSSETSFTY